MSYDHIDKVPEPSEDHELALGLRKGMTIEIPLQTNFGGVDWVDEILKWKARAEAAEAEVLRKQLQLDGKDPADARERKLYKRLFLDCAAAFCSDGGVAGRAEPEATADRMCRFFRAASSLRKI